VNKPLAVPLQKRAHLPEAGKFYIVHNVMTDGVRDVIATLLDERVADAIVAACNAFYAPASPAQEEVKRYTFIMTHGFEPDGCVYEVQPKEPHKHVHPPNRLVDAADYDAALRTLASVRADRDFWHGQAIKLPEQLAVAEDERDSLRSQVEGMRELLQEAYDYGTIWRGDRIYKYVNVAP
jgi:hypothetical protein